MRGLLAREFSLSMKVQYPAFSKAQEIFTSLRILSPGYVPLFVRTIGGIDGHRIALELNGKVRGLPELDEAYLGPSYSTHVTGHGLRTVFNLGEYASQL